MRIDRVLLLAAGMDLEVHVRRGRLGVAGVAGEAEHGAGLDLAAVLGVGREGGEVGVEERVARLGVQPQAVAGDRQRADAVDGPVGDREHGGAEGGEDVVALVLAGVGAGGAEVVGDVGLAVDGEGVALAGEALLDLGGLPALGLLRLGRAGVLVGVAGGGGDDGVPRAGVGDRDADLRALRGLARGRRERELERGGPAVDGDAAAVGEQVVAVAADVADACAPRARGRRRGRPRTLPPLSPWRCGGRPWRSRGRRRGRRGGRARRRASWRRRWRATPARRSRPCRRPRPRPPRRRRRRSARRRRCAVRVPKSPRLPVDGRGLRAGARRRVGARRGARGRRWRRGARGR